MFHAAYASAFFEMILSFEYFLFNIGQFFVHSPHSMHLTAFILTSTYPYWSMFLYNAPCLHESMQAKHPVQSFV